MNCAGVVHVWEIDLALDDLTAAGQEFDEVLAGLVTDEVRARADRLTDPRDTMTLIRSHAAARRLLAAAVGVPAGQIEQTAGVHGKPFLKGPFAAWPEWNMSRSGHRALVAIGGALPVGVDIQLEHSHGDALALAQRYFTPAERDWVAGSPTDQGQAHRLCVLLSRKEAVAKAAGGRLLDTLRHDVTEPGPREWRDECYYITDVPVRRGYAAAVAAAGRAIDVLEHHVCDWRDLCAVN